MGPSERCRDFFSAVAKIASRDLVRLKSMSYPYLGRAVPRRFEASLAAIANSASGPKCWSLKMTSARDRVRNHHGLPLVARLHRQTRSDGRVGSRSRTGLDRARDDRNSDAFDRQRWSGGDLRKAASDERNSERHSRPRE